MLSVQFSTRTLEGCIIMWHSGPPVAWNEVHVEVPCPPEPQRCSGGAGASGSEHAWQMLALLPPQRAQGPRPQTHLLSLSLAAIFA